MQLLIEQDWNTWWESTAENKELLIHNLAFRDLDRTFLALTNNSSSLNQGNHDCDGVQMSDLNYIVPYIFYDYFFCFLFGLVSIEKI